MDVVLNTVRFGVVKRLTKVFNVGGVKTIEVKNLCLSVIELIHVYKKLQKLVAVLSLLDFLKVFISFLVEHKFKIRARFITI